MEFKKRKQIRLKGYDYSQNGLYFVTVCTKDKQEILWKTDVGAGVPDSPFVKNENSNTLLCCSYDIKNICLSEYGQTIENQILIMNRIYEDFQIIKYVIMPNHIHFILKIDKKENVTKTGTSRTPSPTNSILSSVVSTLKRFVNKKFGYNIFQRSSHDHIIRNRKEYEIIVKYIQENPMKWEEDCLYTSNKE